VSTAAAIQKGLHVALRRAHLSDDRELAGRVRDDGRRLVFLLNGLLQTSRLYRADNSVFEKPARETSQLLRDLVGLLGAIHLVCVEDQVYVNDVRLRLGQGEQEVVDHLIEELARHDVGGVSFHAPLDVNQIKALVRAVADPPAEGSLRRAALASRIGPGGSVQLAGRYRFRVQGEAAQVKRDHSQILGQAADVLLEAVANLAAHRLPNPLPVRRAVIDLVDSLRDYPGRGAAEPFMRHALGAPEQHLLSVTSLSILLGQTLGLPEGALSDLGVAAMLHDVGYAVTGEKHRHGTAGARLLLTQRGFHEAKVRRLLVVLEHHLDYEAEGSEDGPPSLFARILRIADDYDWLVAPRSESAAPVAPPVAQAMLWAACGTCYDPDLMALFVQTMGLYPPGSLIEVSDGRRAVSVSGARGRDRYGLPVVQFLTDTGAAEEGGVVDLFEQRNHLRPRRVLNAATQAVDVTAVLVSAFAAEFLQAGAAEPERGVHPPDPS